MNREIKFEIMIEALEEVKGHKKGDRLKLINSIFDRNTGIAFFEIGLKWKIVYQRQFTGLHDKNGKEIYEGDILFNSNKTSFTLKEDKRLYLVKWQTGEYNDAQNWLKNKPSFIFEKIILDGKKYMELIFSQQQIEVVGNIYENPELLTNST